MSSTVQVSDRLRREGLRLSDHLGSVDHVPDLTLLEGGALTAKSRLEGLFGSVKWGAIRAQIGAL